MVNPLCLEIIEILSLNRSSLEFKNPLFSDPAMGWDKINFDSNLFFLILLSKEFFTLVQSVIKSALWKKSRNLKNCHEEF